MRRKSPSLDGDADEVYSYGIKLYAGNGQTVNKSKAIQYFKAAADKGNSNAMYNYGKMVKEGDGVKADREEARKYFKLAADSEDRNVEAMHEYAEICEEDNDTTSYLNALLYYKCAALKGKPESMFKYAFLIHLRPIGQPDYEQAAKYYKMAADKGYIPAMISYATLCRGGDDIPQNLTNPEESARYFKMAADSGNSHEDFKFALYKQDGFGAKSNKIGQDKGDEKCTRNYTVSLENDERCKSDKKEAIKSNKNSADKGFEPEILRYGNHPSKGNDESVDHEGALKNYKMAADKGELEGNLQFAKIVYNQPGFESKKDEALKLLKEAVDKEYSPALMFYGTLMIKGDTNIKQSDSEGLELIRKAAKLGNEDAKKMYLEYCKVLKVPIEDINSSPRKVPISSSPSNDESNITIPFHNSKSRPSTSHKQSEHQIEEEEEEEDDQPSVSFVPQTPTNDCDDSAKSKQAVEKKKSSCCDIC